MSFAVAEIQLSAWSDHCVHCVEQPVHQFVLTSDIEDKLRYRLSLLASPTC